MTKDLKPRFEAYGGFGEVPTDCCKFAVVDNATGVEVCRVWKEEDAREIARLLQDKANVDPFENSEVERNFQAMRYDVVVEKPKFEPSAHKRMCFRAGWDAAFHYITAKRIKRMGGQ